VLVVGGGNSGCEIAVDLAEQGVETSIAIRGGTEFVPFPESATTMRAAAWIFRTVPEPVGEWLLSKVRRDFSHLGLYPSVTGHLNTYPVVGFDLPDAVEAGRVKDFSTGIDHFVEDGVVFEDGQQGVFDAVILATGYRPTLHFVEGQVDFHPDGSPVLKQWRSTLNPHLFCVGYHYPNTEGWLQSIGRVTQQVADALI
jgi:cation diffusion facilitator CzcD-associated flavoprotein CzcO